jgi:hypothetical protein
MRLIKGSLLTLVAPVAIVLAGCGASSSPNIPTSGRHVAVTGSKVGHVVLSPLGAQRIGVQTERTQAVATPKPPPPIVKTKIVAGVRHTITTPAPAPPNPAGKARVIVPYSAVVYDPSGHTYAFANTGPLTYVEVPVTVDHISGNSAYLVKGPKPGVKVVSVGAEELYGVQSGVLAQT